VTLSKVYSDQSAEAMTSIKNVLPSALSYRRRDIRKNIVHCTACVHSGESIPVQTWNSLKGGQVLSPLYRCCLSRRSSAVWFLSRVSILTRDIDIANLSVRPSVRLFVCP